MCEHVFAVGIRSNPYPEFRRAVARGGSPQLVWALALEVGHLELADALRLVLALHGDRRYGRLPARWAARYAITAPAITVQRLQDMLELFADTESPGRSDVAVLARARGLPELADQLRRP